MKAIPRWRSSQLTRIEQEFLFEAMPLTRVLAALGWALLGICRQAYKRMWIIDVVLGSKGLPKTGLV